jgi:L-cysteine:1D-myo-inositol 2-amino-2-deoxy-alpha-D-glucopyranoside ligase
VIAWPAPFVPAVPGSGPAVRVHDTPTGELRELTPGPTARVYVCGITPYDATHLGHAATYVTFDLLGRSLRDAGHEVDYVQNVTDVDEPLLERAERDGLHWEDLAEQQIDLFREDMTALAVIPPDHYVGAVEGVPSDVEAVTKMLASGAAYRLPVPAEEGEGADVYLDLATQPTFGTVSGWTREQMMEVYAERGGDPDRPGKRDALDPLLWRAHREGEPSWDGGELGQGRPGWHIECTTIAIDHLGIGFDVQGGGSDLIFPHHEMSAVQGEALTGTAPFAQVYVHQAMVGLDGEKMSKSKGNLVLVSKLRESGVDPMVIRLALLAHHYRVPWDWTDDQLKAATARLDRWRSALSVNAAPDAAPAIELVRAALAGDLDSPRALEAVDTWVEQTLAGPTAEGEGAAATVTDASAPGLMGRALDALLGIRL